MATKNLTKENDLVVSCAKLKNLTDLIFEYKQVKKLIFSLDIF